MSRFTVVLAVYAVCVIGCGLWAYASAPEGANPTTALKATGAIGAIALALGGAIAGLRSRPKAARVVRLGAVLVVAFFAVMVGSLGIRRGDGVEAHRQAMAEWREQTMGGKMEDTAANREQFFKAKGAPERDLTYLRNTLYAVSGLSILAAGALLFMSGSGGRAGTAAKP